MTFHNQRDFIFVRRHRKYLGTGHKMGYALIIVNIAGYVFKDTEKVGLQELGPRFTLKLRWLQKGTYQRDKEYEWIFKPEMEVNRKRFFL